MINYTVAINGSYHISCGISPKIEIYFVCANSKVKALKYAAPLFVDSIKEKLDKSYLTAITAKIHGFLGNKSSKVVYNENADILQFTQMLSEFGINISITETVYKEGYDNNATNIN